MLCSTTSRLFLFRSCTIMLLAPALASLANGTAPIFDPIVEQAAMAAGAPSNFWAVLTGGDSDPQLPLVKDLIGKRFGSDAATRPRIFFYNGATDWDDSTAQSLTEP